MTGPFIQSISIIESYRPTFIKLFFKVLFNACFDGLVHLPERERERERERESVCVRMSVCV